MDMINLMEANNPNATEKKNLSIRVVSSPINSKTEER